MAAIKPPLPDPVAVAQNLKGWAATQPRFARYLNARIPVVEALTRWSLELLKANQIPMGISVLRSALALTPDDPVLWANYGTALSKSNASDEAAACLQYSVMLSHQQPHTWLLLGLARQKQGNPGAAEAAYRVALEQEPDSSVAWQLIAALREQLRDYAGACDCLIECIKADGANAAVQANLGKLQYQLGRLSESADAYTKAAGMDSGNAHFRQMARKTTFLRELLQGETIDDAVAHYQNSFTTDEKDSEKDLRDLLHSSFSLLSGFGHLEAAARVGMKQIELWPANASLNYLMSAVAQDQSLDRSPSEYVVEHFNAFAKGFDEQLVGVLGYDMPEKICSAVRKTTAAGHRHETLDAGCGTGLCGPLLRPISRTLTGVDLSPKMLEQAARKAVYDALACEDLTTFLLKSPAHFDLIVAADLMVYFGILTPLFAAAATALRPGGLFALSTELWTGEGYHLQPSGRFAHAPQYVRLMAGLDFEEVFQAETTIRLEANRRLPGNIFILRRRG
ncbi:MAG TPA: methyltransferase domain-containing protein [Candidatus Acidoferrum sp.]|nr:methyltransferase domain-containing protein [Candidatus Acidoferrum sp.]